MKPTQAEKDVLRAIYPDYDPKYHDAFVYRLQRENGKKATQEYLKSRGLEK